MRFVLGTALASVACIAAAQDKVANALELEPASVMRVYDLIGVVAPPDAKKPEIFARGNEDLEAFVVVQSEDVTAFSSAEREFDGPPTLKFVRGEQIPIPEGILTLVKVKDESGVESDFFQTVDGPTHFALVDLNKDFDATISEGVAPI